MKRSEGMSVRVIEVRLKEILEARKITQKELADKTNIRAAAISELYNNQRKTINKEHITKIADALDIDDISELFVIKKV
ncbi:helix-turn-helix domain-containing protein [Terribacillus saccharophilus]|uniref:helix-turn-helix domain-containing protein n=1 Tax=Terribacillus saccharophilus TaxID=361277 RepID=UPI00398269A6